MSWPTVQITKVARVVGGATPKSQVAEYWEGAVQWATPKDLSDLPTQFIRETPRTITEAGLKSCAAEVIPEGSVLFSSRAPIGHIAITKTPMATNQGFKSFVPGPRLDAGFLYWWLDANRERLQALGTGATFKELSKATVQRIEIPLPPLEEQKRIAGILDQAAELCRLRTCALDRLGILGQAIFHEMFGDPVDNPKGFPRKKLLEIVDIIGGSQPAKKHFLYDDGPGRVRFVQTRDFRTDAYKTYVPEDLAKRPFSEDDVIIGRYGPPVFQIFRGLAGTYNVALMKAQPIGEITKDFVFHLLQEPKLHGYVVANSERTAGQSGVNLDLLKDYPVYAPPIELQTDFSQRLTEVDTVTRNARRQNLEAQTLFASLQHRAFRGEL